MNTAMKVGMTAIALVALVGSAAAYGLHVTGSGSSDASASTDGASGHAKGAGSLGLDAGQITGDLNGALDGKLSASKDGASLAGVGGGHGKVSTPAGNADASGDAKASGNVDAPARPTTPEVPATPDLPALPGLCGC